MKSPINNMLTMAICLCFMACSSSTSDSNQQSSSPENKTTSPENVAAAGPPSGCARPDVVELTNAVYNAKENYTLTYNWTSVPAATKYTFNFYLNGTLAFSDPNVSGTSKTFTQVIPSGNKMYAEVITICSSSSSPPKPSIEATYFNAIAVDEIVFLAKPTNSVNDICARSCETLKFTAGSILNTDGTTINLSTYSSKIYYLDFDMVKQCISCNGSVASQKVDPAVFNSCLADPSNDYALYDPGKYTVCP